MGQAEGCELLIRAKMVPDRAGADTRVDVTIPLSDLLGMDGASALEDAWLRARAGEHGYALKRAVPGSARAPGGRRPCRRWSS
jgi:hypothetical protein